MAQIRLDLDEAKRGLPQVCMICGEPATTNVRKKFRWHPSWVYFLILIHVIIYVVVAMLTVNLAVVMAPFCDRHRRHWLYRNLLIWLSFVGLLVAGIASFIGVLSLPQRQQDDFMPFVCVGFSLLGLVWVVVVIVAQFTAIRVKEITDSEVVLAGVSEEFADALEEADRERRLRHRRRLSRWEDDEDEDLEPRPGKNQGSTDVQDHEPRPQKRRPPSEEIEE